MKKLVLIFILSACALGAAFGQVQIFEKTNKTNDPSNLLNPEFEIYPNTVNKGDYSLAGKTLSYFFYEEGKTAADFTGEVWYMDLGDGTNVANWGYVNVYFYDLDTPITSGGKKANIACVVNFTGGTIKENLYASLELTIWYKYDYNGYSFSKFDDWSFSGDYTSAKDYYSLNRYVVFWDNYTSKAYFGYYPQYESYDNIVYVNYNLTSGANNGTSWANAFRGDGALQRGINSAKAQATPSDYMQVWVTKSSQNQPIKDSAQILDIPGPLELIGGFAGYETHEFHRGIGVSFMSGEQGNSGIEDNVRTLLNVSNYSTQMPVYIEQFWFSDCYAIDVNSALNISATSAVVRNCGFKNNHNTHADGSAGPGGAGLRFSDKYNSYWGNYLFVERCGFSDNTGVTRGAAMSVRSASKKVSIVDTVFSNNEGSQYASASGLWTYAYQLLMNKCFFRNKGTLDDYTIIQAPGARNNYKDYNSAYQTIIE